MLLEAFLPVFVFVGSFTIIKGIKYSCQKIQYLYINRQFKKAIYKNITKKPYNNNCVICMDDYTENKKRVELFCNHKIPR